LPALRLDIVLTPCRLMGRFDRERGSDFLFSDPVAAVGRGWLPAAIGRWIRGVSRQDAGLSPGL